MSTTASGPHFPASAPAAWRRRAVVKITMAEAKIMLRDVAAVFFAFVFPALLLIALGAGMPGFQDEAEELGGLRPVDVYGPVVIGLAIATTAFTVLPAYLALYRETGVLRRLAVTPASPAMLLAGQLVVNVLLATIGSIIALLAAVVLFDVELPGNPAGLALAFVLSTVASFSLGLVIAAVAKNGRVASGIGMVVYFPMLFFAGVWTPGDTMPDGARAVADFTPLGAATEAMADAWVHGDWPSTLHLLVLAGWAVVGGFAAARLFRWE
ncbi:ABC transporter permease [Phytoactinopolyspora alkaliphila]|uniref:Transport permease protein n=1 Tax=Phytoactinopolyspora alkaliphila TaxID=1783498 RepID=A0A6N9YTU8_9ACTN|nr:ABC transporter permease [Phytoactinopolyspora alkaliphila]NED98357.1 ABC transporter permease [Phytoactinopolyspora alkaliphila]